LELEDEWVAVELESGEYGSPGWGRWWR
jgi:hypothetical protein